MQIRKIDISDLENLQKISIQTFSETFSDVNSEENMQQYLSENLSLEKLKSELENPNSIFYFAENENQILGYLKLNFGDAQTENQDAEALEIERIYVLKAYLGQNIGKILFEKALQIAEGKNCSYIWLGVWEENHRAIRFYEKNGFEIFGNHQFTLGNDIQTDLMMKLTIK